MTPDEILKANALAEPSAVATREERYARMTGGTYPRTILEDTPILIIFSLGSHDDTWLRDCIRATGRTHEPTLVQRVIVQGCLEADRVVAAMTRAKQSQRLPYGGCLQVAAQYATAIELGQAVR